MIAVRALPGSPRYDGDNKAIIKQAMDDFRHYKDAGVDSVFLENDNDIPFIKPPLPAQAVELMTVISREVRRQFDGPIGIQMLEGANETALEIAAKANLDFLRVEAYVYAHVGGAGIIEACAGRLLRKRKEIGCEHIKVFADVKKKHCSHSFTSDLKIIDEVKQAELFLADGIIVTGPRTGEVPALNDLSEVKNCTRLPIVVGSGMTAKNISTYFSIADGFIVGSTFRCKGGFFEQLDPERLNEFVDVFESLRKRG